MCGIYGCWLNRDVDPALLRLMEAQQIHRGPDDEGIIIHGRVGLGLRRLSVIDLKTGHQPIFNEDGSIGVVCNGEIYNYMELSESLKKEGHRFSTKSDVECVVHLYEKMGIDCLQHLNGMFGLAIYDKIRQKLYLARDRLGIKPLYYAMLPGGMLFSSELRSILATGLVSKELDWDGISCFLDCMYIPTPLTPFQNIRKLKAGHYIGCGEGVAVAERAYWRLETEPSVQMPRTEGEAIEMLTSVLRDACRLQLRADVPLCSFLSGGVDSSAVTAFAAMESPHRLRTYHVYFEGTTNGAKMDERQYARLVAERYETDHTEVTVTRNDFARVIPRLIWHLEEPFGDLASVPTYIISEMARKDVTVCLNGSGGDELFAGYPHHSRRYALRRDVLSLMDKSGAGDLLRALSGRALTERRFVTMFPGYRRGVSGEMRNGHLRMFHGDMLNRVMAVDIRNYLQSNVLFLLDKIAMAVSLEGRVPLLDHRFVELAAHMQSSWKYRHGERKYIFKRMMEPYLPMDVLYRKKEGFGAPLASWLEGGNKDILKRIVANGKLKADGHVRLGSNGLDKLNGWGLWKVACLELWYRIIVQSAVGPPDWSLGDIA